MPHATRLEARTARVAKSEGGWGDKRRLGRERKLGRRRVFLEGGRREKRGEKERRKSCVVLRRNVMR